MKLHYLNSNPSLFSTAVQYSDHLGELNCIEEGKQMSSAIPQSATDAYGQVRKQSATHLPTLLKHMHICDTNFLTNSSVIKIVWNE